MRCRRRRRNPRPDSPAKDAPHKQCGTCSSLLDEHYALQKYGWEKDNTYLPEAAGRLTVLKDFKPYDSRKLQLRQCPECNTYYLYRTDYEYLVNGTEDEEFLTRLTGAETAEYLERPAPG